MTPRRALLAAALPAACATPGAAPPLSAEQVTVSAESWHTDLCLPAPAVRQGPLAPFAAEAPAARAFAFGFGLEAWMRAERPGVIEALAALGGGPALVSVRALAGPVPPGTEESVTLRLPAGGTGAVIAFIAGQVEHPPPPAPASGTWLLVPSRLRYAPGFTCNSWVMRALAEAGLPVPVSAIRLRGEAMAALRTEAARQARSG